MNPSEAELRGPAAAHRGTFEKVRGVTCVSVRGPYAYVSVGLDEARSRHLAVYDVLAGQGVSINLVKLHEDGLSFVVGEDDLAAARKALGAAAFTVAVEPSVTMVEVYAAGMRSLCGVMARIAAALLRADVPIVQTGDGPDTVFCLVDSRRAERAVRALREEFGLGADRPGIVVQKFGGRSVGTADARRLAADRVKEAIESGLRPVVVVSAIGRRGEPYATDTLLEHLEAVDPAIEPALRERDMLMACGEIISTVIMAQTLRSAGIRAVALTGGQAGIITDYQYGDAQILEIRPDYIHQLLSQDDVDVVVVAGFQGHTEQGAITTLGRGGSDTTAAALGAALGAERVEIYTHVDGVMTADPETCPDARTLSMVTYEEVANMAHQGAKVLHPRAAELAMLYQIPLWVKSSFVRAPGTLVAPLAAIQPAVKRAVTGVATLARLAYFTLTSLRTETRAEAEAQVYRATGDAGIPFYLNSIGPRTSSFLVEQSDATRVAGLLSDMGLAHELSEPCEMVSVVALNMWEEAGFLRSIAEALHQAGVPMLQMADSECSVSCLVRAADGPAAVRALHRRFDLGG